jgi:hypothetical protein
MHRPIDEVRALVGVVVCQRHDDVRVVERRLELLVILPMAWVVLGILVVWPNKYV